MDPLRDNESFDHMRDQLIGSSIGGQSPFSSLFSAISFFPSFDS